MSYLRLNIIWIRSPPYIKELKQTIKEGYYESQFRLKNSLIVNLKLDK